MKKIQYLFVTIALGLVLTSCGDSFFNQQPEGGVLTEEQYAILPDNLTGSIMGIYSRLYAASDHDEFGKRAIDMYGDIQSGDMAMPNDNYGWFVQYDRGYFYSQARSYMWSFYYEIINLTNLCAVAVEDNVQDMLDGIITGNPTDATIEQAYYYGQVLALRGWCYANLLDFYTNPKEGLLKPSVRIHEATETPYILGSFWGYNKNFAFLDLDDTAELETADSYRMTSKKKKGIHFQSLRHIRGHHVKKVNGQWIWSSRIRRGQFCYDMFYGCPIILPESGKCCNRVFVYKDGIEYFTK